MTDIEYKRVDPPPPAWAQPQPAQPPAPPEPPAEPAQPPAPPSAAEVEARRRELFQSMGWGEPEPQTPAAPAAPAAPAEPAAPAAPPAEPEPPEPPVQPTANEIIERTATATATAVARAMQPATPAPAAAPELSPEDSEDLRVIQYLERTEPKKHTGLAQKFIGYCLAHYKWLEEWYKANPDTDHTEAKEYAKWLEDNAPVDNETVERARIDMAADEKAEAKIRPLQQRIDQMEQDRAFTQNIPKVRKAADKVVVRMVDNVDTELGKILRDAEGNPLVDPTRVGQIEAKNPIADEVFKETWAVIEPMVIELEKTTMGTGFQLDPRNNPVHAQIANFVSRKEEDMRNAPASVRTRDGRQWVSVGDYQQRLGQCRSRQEAEDLDRQVWCLSVDDIEDLLADFHGKIAKATIDKRRATAQKMFGTGAPVAPAPAPTPQPTPQPRTLPPAPIPTPRPRSPSLGGSTDVTAIPGSATPPVKSKGESAADVNFSR